MTNNTTFLSELGSVVMGTIILMVQAVIFFIEVSTMLLVQIIKVVFIQAPIYVIGGYYQWGCEIKENWKRA